MPLKLIAPGSRKGNRFYIVRGSIAGREVEVSTGSTDKESSQRFAAELEVKLWAQSGESAPPVTTFAGAAAAYKAAKNPANGHRGFVDSLIAYFGGRPLSGITPGDLMIAANILKPKAKASTKNRLVVTPGAAVIHFAAEQGWCPYIRIKKFSEKRPETRAVKADDARRLIEASQSKPALYALLCLLFMHGWRISEALALRWQDLDLASLRISKGVSKQGGQRLWKVLDPAVRDALAALPGERIGKVFPWATRWGAGAAIRKLAAPLGLHFTAHMARHTMATQAITAGADLKTVMQLGDWQSIKSVIRYADSEESRQKEVLNSIGEAYRGGTAKPPKSKKVGHP